MPKPFDQWAAEDMEMDFWLRRPAGRQYQTLHDDLVLYLWYWQTHVGWKVCSDMYKAVMAKYDWDLAQGGRAGKGIIFGLSVDGPTPNMIWNTKKGEKKEARPFVPKPDPYKKGGIRAY